MIIVRDALIDSKAFANVQWFGYNKFIPLFNSHTAPTSPGWNKDIINDYVAMVADTPDEMRQTLENIATALKNKETLRPELAPEGLSAYAHNLLPDAVEKMKGAIGH